MNKNFVFPLVVLAVILIQSCGSQGCPDNVLLDELSLKKTSLEYYPNNQPSTLVFMDEEGNDKTYSVEESIGRHQLDYEYLCYDEIDVQVSYYLGEYKRATYTSEKDSFFIELSVWSNLNSSHNSGINDVFLIFQQKNPHVILYTDDEIQLKLVIDNRGNSTQQESEYKFHKQISFNNVSFSNVYESSYNDGYVFYYSEEKGIVAMKESGHLWVIKN